MENPAVSNSSAALLGGNLGLAAVVLVGVGASGASAGALPPFGGFLLMVLGLGIALVAAITSTIGIVATAEGKGRGGRPQALRGLALSVLIVVAVMVAASRGRGLPRINDITTDTADPPVFVVALRHEANQGRDMAYPGESFASQQQAGYPELAALVLDVPPDVAFDRVRAALGSMPRMEITGEDRAAGTLEATQRSALFQFADDVVVRIRPFEDGGSRIDVRSKSRDGKGDLGVNAERIREIFSRVGGPGAGVPAPSGN